MGQWWKVSQSPGMVDSAAAISAESGKELKGEDVTEVGAGVGGGSEKFGDDDAGGSLQT